MEDVGDEVDKEERSHINANIFVMEVEDIADHSTDKSPEEQNVWGEGVDGVFAPILRQKSV